MQRLPGRRARAGTLARAYYGAVAVVAVAVVIAPFLCQSAYSGSGARLAFFACSINPVSVFFGQLFWTRLTSQLGSEPFGSVWTSTTILVFSSPASAVNR